MGNQLGIDFGSTYTYVYKMQEACQTIGRVGAPQDYEGLAGIPTKVFYKDKKTWIGMRAYAACTDPASKERLLKQTLKQHLRDYNKCKKFDEDEDGEDSVDVNDDIQNFFTAIFRDAGIDTATVDRIVFGCPAPTPSEPEQRNKYAHGETDEISYSGNLKGILKNIFPHLSNDQIVSQPEPVLAGMAIIRSQNLRDGTYLFIDLGGSTNDCTILRIKNGVLDKDMPLQFSTTGGTGPAGNDFNEKMQAQVKQKFNKDIEILEVQKAKERVFEDALNEPFKTVAAKCNDGTEVLFTYCMGTNEPKQNEIFLATDCTFRDTFQEVANFICTNVCDVIKQNVNTIIDRVYFVGGSARMLPLRQCIKDTLTACDDLRGILPHENNDYCLGEFGTDAGVIMGEEEERITCSNVVAYGAVICSHENILIAPETFEFQGGFGTKKERILWAAKTKSLTEIEPYTPLPKHQFSYFGVEVVKVSEFRDDDQCFQFTISIDQRLKTRRGTEIFGPEKKEIVYRRKNKYISFWFSTQHGDKPFRYPQKGNYMFPIDNLEVRSGKRNRLNIYVFYTVTGDFYILLLPCCENNTVIDDECYQPTWLGKYVDRKNVRIYSLNAENPHPSGRIYPPRGQGGNSITAQNEIQEFIRNLRKNNNQ